MTDSSLLSSSPSDLSSKDIHWESDDESVSSDSTEHGEELSKIAAISGADMTPSGLGHDIPKDVQKKLRDQMTEPHRRYYQKIMKKKPRKKYLQITKGRGHKLSANEISWLDRKSL